MAKRRKHPHPNFRAMQGKRPPVPLTVRWMLGEPLSNFQVSAMSRIEDPAVYPIELSRGAIQVKALAKLCSTGSQCHRKVFVRFYLPQNSPILLSKYQAKRLSLSLCNSLDFGDTPVCIERDR